MKTTEVIKMEMDKIKQSKKAEKSLETVIDTLQKPSMPSTEFKNNLVHHDNMNFQSNGLENKNK